MIALAAGGTAFAAVATVVIVVTAGAEKKPAASTGGSPAAVTTTSSPLSPASRSSAMAGESSARTTESSALGVGAVPSGYRRATGPAGIQVSIPVGWRIKSGEIPSNDQADAPDGSGSFMRYGGSATPSMSLLDAVAQNEVTNNNIRKGYQRLKLHDVTSGSEEAVIWEFLFIKGGEQRHSFARFWRANGYDYVVYASSAVSGWDELRPIVDVLVATAGPR